MISISQSIGLSLSALINIVYPVTKIIGKIMKLKVWGQDTSKDKDYQIYLKLEHEQNGEDGCINLIACNKYGEPMKNGCILNIDLDYGVVALFDNINSDLGMRTDMVGHPLCYKVIEIKEMMHKHNHMHVMEEAMSQALTKAIKERVIN